ncbi:hypothetical protein C8Q80DRAFT_232993 [Daedaleopsis nitida]|nr:hypothetical protein C8Q80DRAFT_232993 [Daedaleopsis nitida]
MSKYKCKTAGCDYTASSAMGLSKHKCKHLLPAVANMLRKRKPESIVSTHEGGKRARVEIEEPGESSDMAVDFALPAGSDQHTSMSTTSHAIAISSSSGALASGSPEEPIQSTRYGRRIRLNGRYEDYVPSGESTLLSQRSGLGDSPSSQPVMSPTSSQGSRKTTVEEAPDEEDNCQWETPQDAFGLFRRFSRLPKHDPEAHNTLNSVADGPAFQRPRVKPSSMGGTSTHPAFPSLAWITPSTLLSVERVLDDDPATPKFGPFGNSATQFRLMDWFYGRGSETLSHQRFDDLLDLLRSDSFTHEDLKGFNAHKAEEMLKKWAEDMKVFHPEHGWHKAEVHIPMPRTGARYTSVDAAPTYQVNGVHHCHIVDLVVGVLLDKDAHLAKSYQYVPNKLYWQPPPSANPSGDSSFPIPPSPSSSDPSGPAPPPPLRVYTDSYNSDAVLEEEEKLRKMPRIEGDDPDLEYVIVSLLVWSDETALSSFRSAKLWPIYLYFGNLSKYIRGRPTEFAAEHLAYIPDLTDKFKDEYEREYLKPPTKEVLRFCRRELFCRIWLLLMDDKFMKAYKEGIIVMCGDGVKRRLFLRILTYAADYMEKVKITALKPNSNHRCVRCHVHSDDLYEAGSPKDSQRREDIRKDDHATLSSINEARKLVFEKGYSLAGNRVKDVLKGQSLTPIQNAFSIRLAETSFNSYEMLAPDLMHEFELGVWKNTFNHIVRLINAQGEDKLQEFNRRMRLMPTWGRDKIRRFYEDAATRKQMAARDYEAYLVVTMPVIEGLLPLEDDKTVSDLVFELANWHALAKLRMHHDMTLGNLEHATQHMFTAMRKFADTTCARHNAEELPSETAARVRRAQAQPGRAPPGVGAKWLVTFNVLNTYKYHSLGDYLKYIRRYGPSDNYTTQIGEVEHRHVKNLFLRTNRVNFVRQIALQHDYRSMVAGWRAKDTYTPLSLRRQEKQRATLATAEVHERSGGKIQFGAAKGKKSALKTPVQTSPLVHHIISDSKRAPINVHRWVDDHEGDPAVEGFISRLYEHLAARIFGGTMYSERDDFAMDELDGDRLFKDRMYEHKTLRINYTTYDLLREQDVISPRNHADIMVPSPEWDNMFPYWFGRVLGIFTVQASYHGPNSTPQSRRWREYEILWPTVTFVNANEPGNDPFSFINPDDVIRAAYIILRPHHGLTDELLKPSKLARKIGVEPGVQDEVWDYDRYTVAMFPDRDIFMRHHGGGIGHHHCGVSLETSKGHCIRVDNLEGPADPLDCTPTPSQESQDGEDSEDNIADDDNPEAVTLDAEGAQEDPDVDDDDDPNDIDLERREPHSDEDDKDASAKSHLKLRSLEKLCKVHNLGKL